ncbi:phage integrase family protein [Actinocorallia herbida]|uniref:Phage integrase family protein n=1 Tax=Actinocorallia herbida TaxID=58109 RepID=A0A3N1CMK0_9ACTN|nr:tyrosine-type recombinase/integrase [Actinocorallia herbida]ROO82532.1 phage integrase family protein [Actinocorallia herbida]ROO82673.1 phage integrase family protein [Actinocorallia herbida]
MASAEKRGLYWRGRYELPKHLWNDPKKPKKGTISRDEFDQPFAREQDALNAAILKEEEIKRAGPGWRDPKKGDITVREWLEPDKWWRGVDVEPATDRNTRYLIEYHILPRWGERPLNSIIDRKEVDEWERSIPKLVKAVGKGTYAKRTAKDARNLLSVILGDAVPERIDVNAAARQKGRGRKRDRKQAVVSAELQEEKFATPIEALLIAERAGILTGRDDECWLLISTAWTGMRWGEAIGARRSYLQPGKSRYRLLEQLQELDGFNLVPPKDDSTRIVDLPPFLLALTEQQADRTRGKVCSTCSGKCGATDYLFLTRNAAHPSRSDFGERVWHPAADGATPEIGGAQPRPKMPVLEDARSGLLLRPAWPYADIDDPSASYEPPRGGGRPRWDAPYVSGVGCPTCEAAPGAGCRSATGGKIPQHSARRRMAVDLDMYYAPVSWRPLKVGLTPHGLRHSQQTWLRAARIDPVLIKERLGHEKRGMSEHYTHITEEMRAELREVLESLWWKAIDERIRMDEVAGRRPGSRVRLINAAIRERIAARTPDLREAPTPEPIVESVPNPSPVRRGRRDRGHLRVV